MALTEEQERRAFELIERNMNTFVSKFDKVFKRLDDIQARLKAVEKLTNSLPVMRHKVKRGRKKGDDFKVKFDNNMARTVSSMWSTNMINRHATPALPFRSEKLLAFKKPIRIFLIRHAESEGNVDPKSYELYQDHALPLTARGTKMSESTGVMLSGYLNKLSREGSLDLNNDSVGIFVSPYTRTRATLQGLLDGGLADFVTEEMVWESQYLTEMDWGLFEGDGWQMEEVREMPEYERNRCKRAKSGKFYARCPNGESVKDVVMRVDLFTRRLLRRCLTSSYRLNTFVIVSHGITIRAFIMRWFHMGPQWYEKSTNHPNCSVYEIFESESKFIFGGYGHNAELVDMKELNKNLVSADEVRHKYDFKKKYSLK